MQSKMPDLSQTERLGDAWGTAAQALQRQAKKRVEFDYKSSVAMKGPQEFIKV